MTGRPCKRGRVMFLNPLNSQHIGAMVKVIGISGEDSLAKFNGANGNIAIPQLLCFTILSIERSSRKGVPV